MVQLCTNFEICLKLVIENDVEQLSGPESTSIFRDRKGHAGQIAIDTNFLVWLHAIHGVDPLTMPEFTPMETDIREVKKTIDEQVHEDASKGLFSIFSNIFD